MLIGVPELCSKHWCIAPSLVRMTSLRSVWLSWTLTPTKFIAVIRSWTVPRRVPRCVQYTCIPHFSWDESCTDPWPYFWWDCRGNWYWSLLGVKGISSKWIKIVFSVSLLLTSDHPNNLAQDRTRSLDACYSHTSVVYCTVCMYLHWTLYGVSMLPGPFIDTFSLFSVLGVLKMTVLLFTGSQSGKSYCRN